MKVKRNLRTIVIEPDKMGDFACWYGKEIITRRVASKGLECHECHHAMQKGSEYIRDKFIFTGYWGEKQFKVNFICPGCWKGEMPPNVANNRKQGVLPE